MASLIELSKLVDLLDVVVHAKPRGMTKPSSETPLGLKSYKHLQMAEEKEKTPSGSQND